jgi:hypothetical protein
MAITSEATIRTSAASLPSGYTPPVLTPLTTPLDNGQFIRDVAGTEANADPAVGVANILLALETYFDGTFGPALKLDVAQTITANITVLKVDRINTEDSTSIFGTGTEVFRCNCSYQYE